MTNVIISKISNQLKKDIGLNDHMIPQIFGLTSKEYFKKIHGQTPFKYNELVSFSNYLGVTIDNILSDSIDYDVIKKRFITPSYALPEKYLKAAGTYIHTLRYMIEFCKYKFGKKYRQMILDHLQLDEKVLLNSKLMVNLELLNDFAQFVNSHGFDLDDFNYMALYVNQFGRRSQIQSIIKDCTNVSGILKIMVQNQNKYDQNFTYSIKQKGDLFCITGKSNEYINQEIGSKKICSDLINHFKAYTIKNTSIFKGQRPINIINIENEIIKDRQIERYTIKEGSLGYSFS
jgi:hypothetical protein